MLRSDSSTVVSCSNCLTNTIRSTGFSIRRFRFVHNGCRARHLQRHCSCQPADEFGIAGDRHQSARFYVQPALQIRVAKQFLLTEGPDPGTLAQPVLESDVQSFASRVVTSSRFFNLLVSQETAEEVRTVMDELTSSVKRAWRAAFDDYRRQQDSLGVSESSERRRICLMVPGRSQLHGRFQQRAIEMRKIFESF